MRRSRSSLAITVAVAVATGVAGVTTSRTADARDAVVCAPADGPPAKRARVLFEEAVQYEASDPDRALALYQCAASLADRAVIELRIGVVAERLQRDDVAVAAFERYLTMAGSAAPDADTMNRHVAELKASRAKRAAQERSAAAGPPQGAPTTTPPEEERAKTPIYLGWGFVAGAGALAAIGAGLLVDASAKNQAVHALPPGTPWASDQARGTYDAATRSQTIGIICFAVVPALLAVGVVLLVRGSRGSSPASSASSALPSSLPSWASASSPLAIGF